MSKEHGALHGGEEENPVTLWPEDSRSSWRSLPEKVWPVFDTGIFETIEHVCAVRYGTGFMEDRFTAGLS